MRVQEERDALGQFQRGCRGGPGRPPEASRWQKTIRKAVGLDELREVFQVLFERSLRGDTTAARLLLAYRVGKPLPAPDPRILRVELGDLRTASDLHEASARLLGGLGSGAVSVADASALVDMLASHAKLIELSEIEGRIAALEARHETTV